MINLKKNVVMLTVLIILFLVSLNRFTAAQDLQIKFTTKPIPGVPLQKGAIAPIPDNIISTQARNDLRRGESAKTPQPAGLMPRDLSPQESHIQKGSTAIITPDILSATKTDNMIYKGRSAWDENLPIPAQSSQLPNQRKQINKTKFAPIEMLPIRFEDNSDPEEKKVNSKEMTLPNLIADYTPSGWDGPIVASSVPGTYTDGPNLQAGVTTYIDFAFINRDADIPSSTRFYTYLYSDGTYLAGWYSDGLQQNYYGYVEDYEYTFSAGNHTLRILVDATGVVNESNENDNEYSKTFYWAATEPNLIADYTPTGWDGPIVASSVSGTHTDGPNLQAGATTYIDFAFVNRDVDIPSSTRFYTYLYRDGTYLNGWYWDGLQKNHYGYVEDYQYIFSAGNHTLKTKADATGMVSESNENDNEYSKTFYCPPTKPNLIADYTPTGWDGPIVASSVSGTHTDGPNLQAGATTYIDFVFINRDADIPSSTRFYTYLYRDGTYLNGWYWDGLQKNHYGYVEDYQYTFSAGNHTLKTKADATGMVSESNENDNEYSKTFYLPPTKPNLIADYTLTGWDGPIVASSVSGTHTDGPNLQAGATTYIDFAFINRNADIPSSTRFYTYLYRDGSYLNGWYWDGLPEDYYGYVEDYQNTFTGGNHTLKTWVDATGMVNESNENDNEYSKTFNWSVPASITVSSPNGGESWYELTQHLLEWTSRNASSKVDIYYSLDAGSVWTQIYEDTPNDGSATWITPATFSDQTGCRIKVQDANNPTIWDMSDNNFTIKPGWITVTSPNGGETWKVGSNQNITWSTSASYGDVKIELSRNGGSTWESLFNTTPNDGSQTWTVTGPVSNNCLMRITDKDGNPSDQSNALFAIISEIEWTVPITISGDNVTLTRTFGGDASASDGFDSGLDVTAAPPGMTYYAYFELNVFPNYLETDIRKWISPYDTEINWKLKIVNATGITSTLTWNNTSLPTQGGFTMTGDGVNLDMRGQSSTTVTGSVTLNIKYSKMDYIIFNFPQMDWYLISLPLTPTNNNLNALFPNAMAAFDYNSSTGGYNPVTSLDPQKGYWLLIPAATTATISGTRLSSYTENYTTGWHLIGSVWGNTNFTDPNDNPNGSVIATYGYNPATDEYFAVYPPGIGKLEEKLGYWLAVAQPCDLTIGGSMADMAHLAANANINSQAFYQQYGSQPPKPPFLTDPEVARLLPTNKIFSHNYPNPFNPETVIEYALPKNGFTQVHIYNSLGQRIRTLLETEQQAGVHRVIWDGRNENGEMVSNGIYFYHIKIAEFIVTKKMLLLR